MTDRGRSPTARKVDRAARAADYLANERTFLAWLRTAIGLLAVGIVVDKFSLFTRVYGRAAGGGRTGTLTGGALIVLGGIVAALAIAHFLDVRRGLRHGRIEPSPALALVVGAAIVAAAGLLAVVVLRG